MHKHLLFIFCLLLIAAPDLSAKTVRVLFIGNSYIYTNDMPLIIKNMAAAGNDTLVYQSNTPGGTTLQQHCSNATTLNLIAQGNWDFVVLQEQSQLPSFQESQVQSQVYPYARKLDSLVRLSTACAKTVFYMTWGRKNGDAGNCAGWPPVCTYAGMDSLLQLRYGTMAANNNAWISPVAKVWRRLRNTSSNIELYNPDESHPSENGSFAAACSFYSLFFGKDPAMNSYNYTLTTANAAAIKAAAKTVVYDSLLFWQRHKPLPQPAFTNTIATRTVSFVNTSQNATSYQWAFGDGNTSASAAPVHIYANDGVYNVCLTAFDNCVHTTSCKNITIGQVGVATHGLEDVRIYPNPANELLHIDGLTNAAVFHIQDMSLRCVLTGSLSPTTAAIATIGLPTGTYLLTLKDQKRGEKAVPISIVR